MEIVQFEGRCNTCGNNHIEYRRMNKEELHGGNMITWKCKCGAEQTTELAGHYIPVSIPKNIDEFNGIIHGYVVFELPDLSGTEKQLKWGYKIREKSMNDFYRYMLVHHIPLNQSILDLIQKLPTNAQWWIDNSNGTWKKVKEEVICNKLSEIKQLPQ